MPDITKKMAQGVLEIHFNRPEKKNAITEAMYQELADTLIDARIDDQVKVILISGQKSCFTAGNDLEDFMQNPPDDEGAVFRFLMTVADFPKPVIAAVNGCAIGVGTTLLLHCDLVFCGENAQFQMPFVNLGLVPEFGSSYLLPLRVGHVKAAEWLLTGKKFDAREAKAAGLINEVYSDETFFSAAFQHAQTLAKLPPESVRMTKKLMKQTYMSKTLQTIDEEAELFRKRLQSEDFKQAVAGYFKS